MQEQQILALRRLEARLSEILAILPRTAPDLEQPLSCYPSFDWGSIGATVIERDAHGVSLVSWGGHIYKRRNGANKFGDAIWFSRSKGKGLDGENAYERLITLKRMNLQVEPMSERLISKLALSS